MVEGEGGEESLPDRFRKPAQAALHPRGREGPGLLGERLSGRLPLPPRGLPRHVPWKALDDEDVLRIRDARGHQSETQTPPSARRDRAEHRLRHAHPLRIRLRPPEGARGGGTLWGERLLPEGHGGDLRRRPPGGGEHIHDDQRSGRHPHLHVRGGRQEERGPPRQAQGDRPGGYAEGVHSAEGVGLPARGTPANNARPHGLLHEGDAPLEAQARFRSWPSPWPMASDTWSSGRRRGSRSTSSPPG